jgi:hypothetical protein
MRDGISCVDAMIRNSRYGIIAEIALEVNIFILTCS